MLFHFKRLGERQAMLRAAGTIVGLGAKTMGSNNSGKYKASKKKLLLRLSNKYHKRNIDIFHVSFSIV